MKSFVWMMMGVLLAGPAAAQENKTEAAPRSRPPAVSLRVHLLLSRLQGTEKISSLPYTFIVTPNQKAAIRTGTEVPVAVTTKEGAVSFQYKNVGTNLECRVGKVLEGGTYGLMLSIENSSVVDEAPAPSGAKSPAPTFRSRTFQSEIVLRDGQTQEWYSAVEPTTGEVTKLDVTLEVLK